MTFCSKSTYTLYTICLHKSRDRDCNVVMHTLFYDLTKQEARQTLTNPRDAFRGQFFSTMPYARHGFLLVLYRNFVPCEIFNFKNAVTLKTGLGVRQGHWKCHHSIERIRLPIDVHNSRLQRTQIPCTRCYRQTIY